MGFVTGSLSTDTDAKRRRRSRRRESFKYSIRHSSEQASIMWFKRKQRDQSEKSNVQPAKQKRISARSNSSSDYQDYHDDDEHGIRMVEDLIQETKDVAKEVSSAI